MSILTMFMKLYPPDQIEEQQEITATDEEIIEQFLRDRQVKKEQS
jgi:hypothetical protein